MRPWILQWQESKAAHVVFEGEITCPYVLSIPHAGTFCPPEREDLNRLPPETRMRDVDFEVPLFWLEEAQRKNIPTIVSKVHRYVVDLNRAPQITTDSGETKGLFWRETTWGENLLAELPGAQLGQELAEKIVQKYHVPYHAWIESKLRQVKDKVGRAVLIDAHSMPSKAAKNHSDTGAERADIVPGDFLGSSCRPGRTQHVLKLCEQLGFSCKVNVPYSGGYITQHYGQPAAGIEALQIEVNRKIYMNESTRQLNEAGIEQLKKLASGILSF